MPDLQKLLGKQDKFFDLLEASAEQARSSVQALRKLIDSPDQVKGLDEFIATRRADKAITAEIGETLCTNYVTVLDRQDIEALSFSLYKIPKTVEKIGERILLAPQYLEGVDLARPVSMLASATDILAKMVKVLRRGGPRETVKTHNDELQSIEGEADKMVLELLRWIYSGQMEGRRVVFLKDLFELMEKVTDRCRDAGNVVMQILLKSA